jgi:tricorn protease
MPSSSYLQRLFLAWILFISLHSLHAQGINPLARHPALGQNAIAFLYADDLWTVPRSGGEATRLTATHGVKDGPFFSPDGKWLAYSASFEGNVDIYVIPSEGGQPRRLTYHPGRDTVVGWTPDSNAVLFTSNRDARRDIQRLYRVTLDGKGLPQPFPLPSSDAGALSPDGTRIAYVPFFQWQHSWKRYRGGQTTPIWIVNLKSLDLERIPRENSNDFNAMWVGDKVYFLSDRNGPVALFSYDPNTHNVEEVVANHGLDFKSATSGPGGIAYEQFGDIHLYDLNTHSQHPVPISIRNDLPELREHLIHPDPKLLQNLALSPTGERAAVEVRGDIYTIPHEKGDTRNLTHSADAADRDPAWSPDGKWIAYFSDRSGNYALYLQEQNGLSPARRIDLGAPPSFFYSPTWSPDSKRIAYTDKRLNLWYVDIDAGVPVKVDTDYSEIASSLDPNWSPDSQWLVYTKDLPSDYHAIYAYSLATHKSQQLTDGMSDARHPVFDHSGKYLYFVASTDIGPAADSFDLSADNHPVTSSAYLIVLPKDETSPLKPESDEETIADKKEDKNGEQKSDKKDQRNDKDAEKEADKRDDNDSNDQQTPTVKIDFEGIDQRILALPMPAANYVQLQAGKDGILFALEGDVVQNPAGLPDDEGDSLHRFDLSKRKEDVVLNEISTFLVSFDGNKILYRQGDNLLLAAIDDLKPDGLPQTKNFNLANMEVMTNPRVEWRQMYHETWRIERDFFYDPHYHGLDLQRAEAEYAPYLDRLGSRSELDYLFEEMLGNLTVGHEFIGGPPDPPSGVTGTGLLGADYGIEGNRYKFVRIYTGENWNPNLHAPLTEPGVNVRDGELLLAVNGQELHASDNLFRFFQGTSGKQTVLRVGSKPDGSNGRDVTVVPIGSEEQLRTYAWIEGNRRLVEKRTNGRVAYVYLPDTADGGFTYFTRYFYAQVGKQAAILDERFNHGGKLADYVIDALRRPVQAFTEGRDGANHVEPGGAIFGPKIMLINQHAGSGGDALPWLFRKEQIGKLIGTRTWGGLVGIGDYPALLDGGTVTAPRMGVYGTTGQFEVENRGIQPDITVEMTPKECQNGNDPQLERTIQEIVKELDADPLPTYKRPPFPDYHQQDQR